MSKVSIRQPVVLYAMVFMLLVAFSVVTIASVAMVGASRRAYRRAVTNELKALSGAAPAEYLPHHIGGRRHDLETEVGLVTTSSPALGVTIAEARRAAQNPQLNSPIVSVRLPPELGERYLIARYDTSTPVSIAFVEVTRMIPMVLIGALLCAGLLAFMIGRLVLPPLTALAELAQDVRAEADEVFAPSDAPNEIVEVARNFRTTIRILNDERAHIEAQRDELERMQASLVRASKLASVGRLAAGIAHEIGNPLSAVQGYLSLMKMGLDEAERADVLERCTKELGRIHETIKQLLTYAREGEPAQDMVPISTGKVVAETLALVRGHPALRSAEIDNRIDDLEEDAIGRANRLEQVLVNLILNAGHAMEAQEEKRIVITRELSEERLTLTVTDSGPGIPEAQREQIFDPFFTTKDPGEGTGLGLAISRSLVEAMDGDLEVAPSDAGAKFVIHLRRRARPDPTPEA